MKKKFSFDWVVQATKGEALSQNQLQFLGIGTDTRSDLSDQIFIALKGQNFDGHNFLDQAVEKGAKLLVVNQLPDKFSYLREKVSVVRVDDTLIALQKMAQNWRRQNKSKIIGITGSNGKTTTKEFAATILRSKYKTYASPGSFNNHWGVPLSLLWMDSDIEYTVIEMGMNHKGEISHLCSIAEPDIVLVTMVGSAHIGELGSQQAIAEAKEEIYTSSPNAIKIFNKDNQFTIEMFLKYQKNTPEKDIYTFSSFDKNSHVSLRVEAMELGAIVLSGHIGHAENKIKVPIFGRHNINNIMAACCIALACEMSPDEIWNALPNCQSIWGRNQLFKLNSGASVLFDAYNANFESMSALIKNLYEFDLTGKRFAVIGQMLELGEESRSLHEQLGELVARTGFHTVWFIGPDKDSFALGLKRGGFQKNLYLSNSYEEPLAIQLGSMLNNEDIAIIKGSRGMKLEQVLEAWQQKNY